MAKALPTRPAPDLSVPTLQGGTWTLAEQTPETFTIVVFYRGKHCPICKTQIKEIDPLIAQATAQGIGVIAISMDDEARARATLDEIGTKNVTIGYGMSEATARNWGLYMSSARPNTAEPARFSEPGVFVMRADGTVFFAQTQSAPFTRPDFGKLLSGLKFVTENTYPTRGDLIEDA